MNSIKPTASRPDSGPDSGSFAISRYKHSRHWALHDPDGALVCVTVYKKGAKEVALRLSGLSGPNGLQGATKPASVKENDNARK